MALDLLGALQFAKTILEVIGLVRREILTLLAQNDEQAPVRLAELYRIPLQLRRYAAQLEIAADAIGNPDTPLEVEGEALGAAVRERAELIEQLSIAGLGAILIHRPELEERAKALFHWQMDVIHRLRLLAPEYGLSAATLDLLDKVEAQVVEYEPYERHNVPADAIGGTDADVIASLRAVSVEARKLARLFEDMLREVWTVRDAVPK